MHLKAKVSENRKSSEMRKNIIIIKDIHNSFTEIKFQTVTL